MKTLWRLLSYLKPYRRRFAVSFLLAMMTIGNDLLVPTLFGWTVSRGLQSGDLQQVLLYAGLLVLAQGFKSAVNYTQWVVQHRVGQNIVRDLRNQLYTRLQQLPPGFYRDMSTGQIMSRVTSDVEAIQEYLGWGFLIQI
ncbi:MAG: hypothetical protein KC425_21975, partial [Anaerolineales bacterium]|nr:hypothetical protein [Anaerolineales bacterium]